MSLRFPNPLHNKVQALAVASTSYAPPARRKRRGALQLRRAQIPDLQHHRGVVGDVPRVQAAGDVALPRKLEHCPVSWWFPFLEEKATCFKWLQNVSFKEPFLNIGVLLGGCCRSPGKK